MRVLIGYLVVSLIMTSFFNFFLDRYYGINSGSSVGIVGHSQIMLALNKKSIEEDLNVSIAKFTVEGCKEYDKNRMIQILLESNRSIETIIYAVDPWMFTEEGLSSNSKTLLLPFLPFNGGRQWLKQNFELGERIQYYCLPLTRYNEVNLNGVRRGYLGQWENLKRDTISTRNLENQLDNHIWRSINSSDTLKKAFEMNLNMIGKKNIILVNTPTHHLYNNQERTKYREEISYFERITNENDNIYFVDLASEFEGNEVLYYDAVHLNNYGQQLVTKRFVEEMLLLSLNN